MSLSLSGGYLVLSAVRGTAPRPLTLVELKIR